ncbi:hypothetical protein [Corynebacterium sp. HMSC05D08]|uniref:hypothetical protein n=1 Tax=Corynebacterium sp. HMSC05D08 TaxID=1581116 RepID=UPI0008A4903D|nr:hypothetical protein [Corynebacterium sp. HMSC05D08]OFT60194.1 hypothetical protein HMPREF3148_12575 [Corynebacterium sp. HMSC05D08]
MTDLTTSNLKRLLAEVTPGPWKHDNEVGEILGAYYEKNGIGYIPTVGYADDYNADLIALAPELADEILRMRKELIDWADDEAQAHNALVKQAQEAGGAGIITTHKTIYNRILDILGDHDD